MQILHSGCIWQQAAHNAFTDLLYYRQQWWCAFREASSHTSADGVLRVLSSAEGRHWQARGLIALAGADLRDAKLSQTPQGELMLLGAAAYQAGPVSHQCLRWLSQDGEHWGPPQSIAAANHWLWRLTWQQDSAYGLAYGTGDQDGLHWYQCQSDGQFHSHRLTEFDGSYVNEHGLVFDDDGTAYCLLRRDLNPAEQSTGLLGVAKPPYQHWQWHDLGFRLGGPALIWGPGQRTLLAAYRRYQQPNKWLPQWTEVAELSLDGRLLRHLQLPSGGDCSYPGLALQGEQLKVIYYSSHEQDTRIYQADIQL